MNFKYTDAGRVQEGFTHEKNDCSVRAAAVRFTTSYSRAHQILEELGRRDKRGARLLQIKGLFERMGLEYQKPLFRPTLAQFLKDHPAGRFYVIVRGHAVGVVNGVCQDVVTPRLRQRVILWG